MFDEFKAEAIMSNDSFKGRLFHNKFVEGFSSLDEIEKYYHSVKGEGDELGYGIDYLIDAIYGSSLLLDAIRKDEFSKIVWTCPSTDNGIECLEKIEFESKEAILNIAEFIREFNIAARETMKGILKAA